MKIKSNIITIVSLFIITILLSTTAFGAGSITIDIKGETNSNVDYSKDSWSFKIWKVGSTLESDSLDGLNNELDSYSEADLDLKYEYFISPNSDENGLVHLSLDDGVYYAREYGSKGSFKFYPFVFIVGDDSPTKVLPKGYIERPGRSTIVKRSPSGDRLAGAEFELYYSINNNWISVPLTGDTYDPSGSVNRTLTTDGSGEIRLYDLPKGSYMLRETKAPAGYYIVSDTTYFDITDEPLILEIINYKDSTGGHKFIKVTTDGSPIPDTRFIVTKKSDDYYDRIKKDSNDYVLTSNHDGTFNVESLPYGEYVLWEIQPALGYSAISDGVSFEIDDYSNDRIIEIKNKRIPVVPTEETPTGTDGRPNPIVIPKTGDITILLMIGGGILLSGIGISLVKDGRKDDGR